jgi:hypothetical protein
MMIYQIRGLDSYGESNFKKDARSIRILSVHNRIVRVLNTAPHPLPSVMPRTLPSFSNFTASSCWYKCVKMDPLSTLYHAPTAISFWSCAGVHWERPTNRRKSGVFSGSFKSSLMKSGSKLT